MLENTSRLSIHTITTKPWPIETCIEKYAAAGARGISVWREALEGRDLEATGKRIRDAGLKVTATVRGGFFPALSPEERAARIEENKKLIDISQKIGSPLLVLVTGAHPKQELSESYRQIRDGIAAILPYAEKKGVRLAIEPLHPMYADARTGVTTLRQANDMCVELNHPCAGVAVDVYHLWWDPALEREIERSGAMNKIFAFHVSDWLTPTRDFLNDRGLMGDGCINIPKIRRWVENSGWSGLIEVEIFSDTHWAEDQDDFLRRITRAFCEFV